MTLTRNVIIDCSKITRRARDITRLEIAEAVIISSDNPLINRQDIGNIRTFKLSMWNIMCNHLYSNILSVIRYIDVYRYSNIGHHFINMENFANLLIRNIENIEKKLINYQLAVVFNRISFNEQWTYSAYL